MIRFSCQCGREFKVADEQAGRKGKCPACGAVNRIPQVEAVPVLATDDVITGPAAATPTKSRWLDLLTRKTITFYLAGILSGFLLSVFWSINKYASIFEGNSPEYMLAAVDLQKPIRSQEDFQRVALFKFYLDQCSELYEDPSRFVAYDIADTVSALNHDGIPTDALILMLGASNCAKKAKEREGLNWERIKIRSFCSIYNYFRRELKLNHNDAIKRIDEMEKI